MITVAVILSLILAIFSVLTVTTKSLFRSAIYLAGSLIATGFIYILLGAEILGFMQIILYAGGITVLIVFAIMVTKEITGQKITQVIRKPGWGFLAALFVFGFLAIEFSRTGIEIPESFKTGVHGGKVAFTIFKGYPLPFEILSLLILAGLVGALTLARRDRK